MVSKCNVEGGGGRGILAHITEICFRIALPRTRQITVKFYQMPFFGLALFSASRFYKDFASKSAKNYSRAKTRDEEWKLELTSAYLRKFSFAVVSLRRSRNVASTSATCDQEDNLVKF